MTAHAIQLPYGANSDYTSSKAIYKADKNLFASHSNYESEQQHSPSLDNLETEKASIRWLSAPWLTSRYSDLHLRGKSVTRRKCFQSFSNCTVFIHCHCHQLQLACVQAENGTAGIEHVYVTLTTLWKFFYYSSKRAQSLKEVQKVLDFPELKIVKPSNTRWLAHE